MERTKGLSTLLSITMCALLMCVSFVLFAGCGDCKVTFNLNGAPGSIESIDIPKNESFDDAEEDLPVPSWAGHKFEGWFTTSDCTGSEFTKTTKVKKTPTKLYAKWSQGGSETPVVVNNYTITLNTNGGKFSDNSQTRQISVMANATCQTPESPTHTDTTKVFIGWFTTTEGNSGQQIGFPYVFSRDTTLFARWGTKGGESTTTQYTLTLNANGGTLVGNSTITQNSGTYWSQPTNPTKANAVFKGWYSELSGGEKITFPKSVDANLTVYAQWSSTYTIAFSDSSTNITAEIDQVVEINNPTKSGYTFDGWSATGLGASAQICDTQNGTYTSWNGTTKYTYFKNLAAAGGTVTLTAHWTENTTPQTGTYTVRFLGKDNEVLNIVQGGNTINYGTEFFVTNPSYTGFTFDGWTSSNLGANAQTKPSADATLVWATWNGSITKNTYFKNLANVGGTVTIQGHWTENSAPTCSVSFQLDWPGNHLGGYSITQGKSFSDMGYSLPDYTDQREGYTFDGWWQTSDFTGTQFTSTTKVPSTTTITLYAKWTQK